VRGGQRADAQRLRQSVGAADVGHQVARGASLDQVAELEARVVVLPGRDGDPDRTRHLRAAGWIVGERRLFVPDEIEIFEHARLTNGAVDVELLVHVDHHPDAVAHGLLHRLDAATVLERIGVMDLHLVVAAAHGRVARGLADQVVDGVRAPAATAVRGHAVGHGPPQLREGLPRRLARDVPEPDVERGERIAGDADLPDAAIRAIHLVPEPPDLGRVFADE